MGDRVRRDTTSHPFRHVRRVKRTPAPVYHRQSALMAIKLPRVYPILDTESLSTREILPETAASAFLEGGAGILQLRHKGHWNRSIFACAQTIGRLCGEAGA